MNILVTGGAGLIGMAVREDLAARGHKVIAIDITDYGRGDKQLTILGLEDRAPLEALIDDNAIEAIVHAGAISGPMLAKGRPLLLVSANIDATALLLDLARVKNMRRFVFCSSISVYGNVGKAVISEETPLHPTSVYGATKVACEQLIEGFAGEFGLSGVSLRIARVYGPYRRANCHLGNIVRDADAGRTTEIGCEPDFPYHYVYADDVAAAIATVLEADSLTAFAYNVGGGRALTMPEIKLIAEAAIPKARVRLVEGNDDVPDVQTEFSIQKAKAEICWSPAFDLARGLRSYADAIHAGRSA